MHLITLHHRPCAAVDTRSSHCVDLSEFRELILHMAAADLHHRRAKPGHSTLALVTDGAWHAWRQQCQASSARRLPASCLCRAGPVGHCCAGAWSIARRAKRARLNSLGQRRAGRKRKKYKRDSAAGTDEAIKQLCVMQQGAKAYVLLANLRLWSVAGWTTSWQSGRSSHRYRQRHLSDYVQTKLLLCIPCVNE